MEARNCAAPKPELIMPQVSRGKFQGTIQIVRFNWTFYVAASVVLLVAAALASKLPFAPVVLMASGTALFWLITSLAVSYYIYDRAGLYDSAWIQREVNKRPSRWATFHTGLDEFSPILSQAFAPSEGSVVDFFDETEMTEASIKRARAIYQPDGHSIAASFRALPFRDSELDHAFAFFAAHELRKPESRAQFFCEVRRVLRPRGQLMVLEHLRDWPNFLAFGPGFVHFHSRRNWLRAFAAGNFQLTREFSITPFVRGFVLENVKALATSC